MLTKIDKAMIDRSIVDNGEWVRLPAIYKLIVNGSGLLVLDGRDAQGVETLAFASYTVSGPQELYPYLANAYELRSTVTGTVTVEIA